MAFSREHHEIARLPVFDHIPDRLLTVCNLNESAFCFPDSRPDIVQNRLWFLIPRIVRGDDGQIRQTPRHLSHLESPVPRAVSAAAEETDQALRMVFPQCL